MEQKPKKVKKARISKIDKENRVFQVFKWIVEGYTKRSMLLRLISDSELFDPDMTERQKDNYIRDAREKLRDKIADDADFELDLALNRLEALFTMNYKINDFAECRRVVMDRAKLRGLVVEKQKNETTVKVEQPLFGNDYDNE